MSRFFLSRFFCQKPETWSDPRLTFPAKLRHRLSGRYDPSRLDIIQPSVNRFEALLPLFVARVLVFPAGENLIDRGNGLARELLIDGALESVQVVRSICGRTFFPLGSPYRLPSASRRGQRKKRPQEPFIECSPSRPTWTRDPDVLRLSFVPQNLLVKALCPGFSCPGFSAKNLLRI